MAYNNEILNSKYLLRAPWFNLRADEIALSHGHIMKDYYVLEYNPWANAIAFTDDGHVILVRQYRHAAGIMSLEVPGGVVEDGETPLQGVQRELLEETGYTFNEYTEIAALYANPATANNKTHIFICTGGQLVAPQNLDADENLQVETYRVDEVKQFINDGTITHALHIAGLLLAFNKMSI